MKSIVTTLLSLAAAAAVQAQVFTTVGRYDSISHPNMVDIKNPSAAYYAGFVPAINAGWGANKAGVVNFDVTNSFPWNVVGIPVWKAQYGVGLMNHCVMAFGHPVRIGNMLGAPWVPISGSPNQPGAITTVGATPLIFKLQANQITPTGVLAPVPVRRAGITVLQRMGIPQKVKVNFYQAGGPTLTTTFLIPAGGGAIIPNRDTFVGRDATVLGGIIAVEVISVHAATGVPLHVACDDFAFFTF